MGVKRYGRITHCPARQIPCCTMGKGMTVNFGGGGVLKFPAIPTHPTVFDHTMAADSFLAHTAPKPAPRVRHARANPMLK